MKLRVFAKPGAKKSELAEPSEFERSKCDIVAFVKSPPLEGRANREIWELLEGGFPGKIVALVSGGKSRLKTFEIS